MEQPDWDIISHKLREPFNPADVDFRVQGKVNGETGKAQVVAYIDARAVQDRLDDVVGAGSWSFEWEPLAFDKGEVSVAKGTLTIYGVSKADAGTASNFEQTLGAVSHCFKRAAVHWGIGRYLYDVSSAWVPADPKSGRISTEVLGQLRAKLPRPGGTTAQPARQAPEVVREEPALSQQASAPVSMDDQPASPQQLGAIAKLCAALGKGIPGGALTYAEAKAKIADLQAEYQRTRKVS